MASGPKWRTGRYHGKAGGATVENYIIDSSGCLARQTTRRPGNEEHCAYRPRDELV
jgi:hypothetical protein